MRFVLYGLLFVSACATPAPHELCTEVAGVELGLNGHPFRPYVCPDSGYILLRPLPDHPPRLPHPENRS